MMSQEDRERMSAWERQYRPFHLRLGDWVRGGIYTVRCRNLLVAVYRGGRAFTGIRTKFGSRFLDTEYAAGSLTDVMERLGQVPDGIELRESVPVEEKPCSCGHADELHSREVGDREQGIGHGWHLIGCWLCDDDHAYDGERYMATYKPLFQLLEWYEERLTPEQRL